MAPRNHKHNPPDLGPALLPRDDRRIAQALALGPHAPDFVPGAKRKKNRHSRTQLATWHAQPGMPKWQAILVANGLMCGAKLNRHLSAEGEVVHGYAENEGDTPLYCRSPPVPGQEQSKVLPYRCRWHGGNAVGGPDHPETGNQRARQHGLYSKVFVGEDLEFFEALISDDEDRQAELRGLRREIMSELTRLRKARILQREQEALIEGGAKIEDLVRPFAYTKRKKQTTGGLHGASAEAEETVTKQLVDFDRLISRMTGDLCRKLMAQDQLLRVVSTDEPQDYANKARALMEALEQTHTRAEGFEGDS